MKPNSSISFQGPKPSVVATIGSEEDWRHAEKLLPGQVDFLEVRADLLLEHSRDLPGKISDLPLPVILTVRATSEGGKGSEESAARSEIFHRLLAEVAGIDLELASVAAMETVISKARNEGVKCIFSFHDFIGTPCSADLEKMVGEAKNQGADLFKVATTTHTITQLMELARWLEGDHDFPIAAMGMGRLGKISRPLLAQLGSRLNYGYLHAPLVSGQWSATALRQMLDSLAE